MSVRRPPAPRAESATAPKGMTLRYGIVGTGAMGLEHMRNIALLEDAEVTAIAEPNEKPRRWARKVAAETGIELPAERVFESCSDLVDADRASNLIDALVIATPNYTHAEVLEPVWGSGLHVMVEKPMCTTLEDCLRVEKAAAAHNGTVWVGMEYRYMPPVARLIEEVRNGTAGELRMVAIREHRQPFLVKIDDWNRFNRNTGGTLVEKCCHFFDLMVQITGKKPRRVFATGAQDLNHLDELYNGEVPDILDNAYVIVDFEDGVRGMLDLCMFAEGSRNEQEICAVGDRGKVECFVPESTVVLCDRETRRNETSFVPVDQKLLDAGHHHGSTFYEHQRFLAAVRDGGPIEVSVKDGTLAVAIGVAAHRSIETGQAVDMAELLQIARSQQSSSENE